MRNSPWNDVLEQSLKKTASQAKTEKNTSLPLHTNTVHLAGPNSNTVSVYQHSALDALELSMFCAEWLGFAFSPKWRASKYNGEVTL